MTLLQRIENIGQLWELIVPHVPKPSASWISRWCAYPDEAIERGIIRAAKKFTAGRGAVNPTPELVYQYVCGVARNEFEARHG
jgi:hypothetical protein